MNFAALETNKCCLGVVKYFDVEVCNDDIVRYALAGDSMETTLDSRDPFPHFLFEL